MWNFLSKDKLLIIVIACFVFAKICLWDTYFFWDSVATLSKPAHFLYENNFSSLIFPPDLVDDNLCLSAVLAGTWKIFGRTMSVTHLLFMLIGVILIIQLYKLCRHFVKDEKAFPFIFLLAVSDTAVVTQSLLWMTDTVMLLFAVMAIRYMLENKKIACALSLVGLSVLRMRGFCMCMGLGVVYFLYLWHTNDRKYLFFSLKQVVFLLLPAVICFSALFILRSIAGHSFYYFRNDSPWAEHYHLADRTHFLKNIISIGRFFLDYGRLFGWIVFLFLLIKFGRKGLWNKDTTVLWIIFGGSLLCMLVITLPMRNPMGFRYFMLQYVIFSLLVGILLFRLLKRKQAAAIAVLLTIGLWSGHFWIYPEKISQGWDSTLAHLPYYDLRHEALQYIEDENIDYEDVFVFFPADNPAKFIELNNDTRTFAKEVFDNNPYIIYSIIGNWSDDLIEEMQQNYTLQKSFSKRGIFIKIYKRKRGVM